MDYLLQRTFSPSIPDKLIIASTAMLDIIQILLQKSESTVADNIPAYKKIRRKLSFFSFCPHHLIASVCNRGHFVVVSIMFDANNKDVFTNVEIYDSLIRSSRSKASSNRGQTTWCTEVLSKLS
jgi:hypothetical protein